MPLFVPYTCPSCHQATQFPADRVGGSVWCPYCRHLEVLQAKCDLRPPADGVTFSCPCGIMFRALRTSAGDSVICPQCALVILIPAPPPPPSPPAPLRERLRRLPRVALHVGWWILVRAVVAALVLGLPALPALALWRMMPDDREPPSPLPTPTSTAEAPAYSPLDRLAADNILPIDRPVALPSEAVALVGDGRGRQWKAIETLAVAPDGKRYYTGGLDRAVRVWDAATRQERSVLQGHPSRVRSLAFSADGKLLAAGGWETHPGSLSANLAWVQMWRLDGDEATAGALLTWPASAVTRVALSPDGTRLAVAGGGGTGPYAGWVQLYDLTGADPREILTIPSGEGVGSVSAVAFSPRGDRLAFGTRGKVELWQVGAANQQVATFSGFAGWSQAVCFSPDGWFLAAGDGKGRVRLWDLSAAPRELSIGLTCPGNVLGLTFSPDGRLLACSGDAFVWVEQKEDDTAFPRARREGQGIAAVAFASPGALYIAGPGRGVDRWEFDRKEPSPPDDRVMAAALSRDGRLLVTGCADGKARIYQLGGAAPRLRASLTGHTKAVRAVAIAPDTSRLATAGEDQAVMLWNLTTHPPRRMAAFPSVTTSTPEGTLAFAPDGKTLAVGGGKVINWLDVAASPPKVAFFRHGLQADVYSLTFSPDGSTLAAACDDGGVRFFDGPNGMPRANPVLSVVPAKPQRESKRADDWPIQGLAFHPNGREVLLGVGHALEMWSIAPAPPRKTLWLAPSSPVSAAAFTTDGEVIASIDHGSSLLRLQPLPVRLTLPAEALNARAFLWVDENTLATLDGVKVDTVRRWAVRDGALHSVGTVPLPTLSQGMTRTPYVAGATLAIREEQRGVIDHLDLLDLTAAEGPARSATWARPFAPTPTLAAGGLALVEAGGTDAPLRFRDLRWPDQGWKLSKKGSFFTLALSPDGTRLALQESTGLRLYETGVGSPAARAWRIALWRASRVTTLVGVGLGAVLLALGRFSRFRWRRAGWLAWVALLAFAGHLWWWTPATDDRLLAEIPLQSPGAGSSLTFSPDGGRLAWREPGASVRVFDVAEDELREVARVPAGHGHLAFSPDGRRLAFFEREELLLWDLADSRRREVALPGLVTALTPASDGRHWLTVNGNGTAAILRLGPASKAEPDYDDLLRRDPHDAEARLARARLFLDRGEGKIERLKDVPFAPAVARAGEALDDEAICRTITRDGKLVATGRADGRVRLWDARTGRVLRSFEAHPGGVRVLCFAADGRRLLSGGADGKATLWDAGTGRALRSFEGHSGPIAAVALTPDAEFALTGAADGLRLWDATTGRPIARPVRTAVADIEVSVDGRLIRTTGKEPAVWRLPRTARLAIADLTAAAALLPEAAEPLLLRAAVRLRGDDAEAAVADATLALQREPQSAEAYFVRGLAQARRRVDAAALADFTAALKLAPEYARALYYRGQLLAERGEYAAAKKDLDRALLLDPGLAQAAR